MKRTLLLWGGGGVLLLLFTVCVCAMIGSVQIPLLQVPAIVLHQIPWLQDVFPKTWPNSYEQILLKVRIPRVVVGLLVGACLSLSGAAFQGILRNPLADPYTLGVSSGASVGAAFIIYFGLQYSIVGQWSVPLVAFVTGILTLWLVIRLAQEDGKIPTERLILSGVVMQAFLGAFVSLLISLSDKTINEIMFWLMGSLSMRGWSYAGVLSPYLIIGFVIVMGYSRSLNIMALGERQAAHLGMNVERTKMIVLMTATLMTAAAVSVSGVIGFVGLIVPHLIRLLVGPDYRIIVPLSALGGGIYMVIADTLARSVLAPTEIPLGVVTAFIGAPFFAYLLHRNKKTRRSRS
ncbi:iron ABC transporter [Paenibacillus selenitireducens]|uniref:Iron ABC transporter n=1 Tax=Paenibacillus selenitireducens TaxID=1324314 RepID=A0A1T2XAH7_9BACL|nr:iron chelate uptake ABC transporter family permease subunit [Paenibacillus selenitireducens]OPA76899.1 iron ABC transporter [Paenibacillus selenitireducens]